ISPYAYCAGDPVNIVDPTGMYLFSVDSQNGNIVKLGEEDEFDEIEIKGKENRIRVEHVNGKSILSGIEGVGEGTTTSVSSSSSQLLDAFFFLADNTEIEWSIQIGIGENQKDCFVLGTSRLEGKVESAEIAKANKMEKNLWFRMHSHPDEMDGTAGGSTGDLATFQTAHAINPKVPLHFVYHNGIVHLYNKRRSSFSGWERKKAAFDLKQYWQWYDKQLNLGGKNVPYYSM
ncbi:MAG: hypothetical protein HUJ97_08570, partial [Bacteroidales bacterium]|nr:hypothetical protein [Bacteroidales bacterium]